jgi:uncharacterized protein (DUF1330 family)
MPAYIVFTRIRTRNPAELKLYAAQAPAFMAGHTVKRHANFGPCEVLEGPGVEGVAILEFASVEAAKAWYESPAYQEASRHRYLGGDYSAIVVEGLAPVAGTAG